MRDLDSPLVLSYEVFAQSNDNGTLAVMLQRMAAAVGWVPKELLTDAGYVSIRALEISKRAGVRLYAPVQENDTSAGNGKKAGGNQHARIPKTQFTWLPEEQAYQCPEGHRLSYVRTTQQKRFDYEMTLHLYECAPEHCQSCPRAEACTSTPRKGRTVSRLENEELLDALRERMQAPPAKALYKLRRQTVELNYADVKEHRGLRRFRSRTLARARAQVGTLMLAHNLLAVEKHVQKQKARPPTQEVSSPATQIACLA